MNYFINDLVKLNTSEKVNAQGKARRDVMHTFSDCGYEVRNILNYRYSWGKSRKYHHYPILTHWIAIRQANRFLKDVKEGDTVAIQDFHLRHMQHIATECLKKKARVILVIHDVQSIRFNVTTEEVRQLNNASLLLVHTPAMEEKLRSIGVTTPMRTMMLFDYYSDSPMTNADDILPLRNEVVFAGNLAKSDFLHHIIKQDGLKGITLRLYGMKGNLDTGASDGIEYCGMFEPEKTDAVKGGWGLVWDGNSIETCAGGIGNYLRYNSSHKMSLYLACGIPLIVWSRSSLASWVRENNVGIVTDNLNSIADIIRNIPDEEYRRMIDSAHRIGVQLRKGSMLKQCITQNSRVSV